jgi:hypothetical protein
VQLQTLVRYFGFRVELTEELDPARLEVLRAEASRIISLEDYKQDPDQFFVYFHQLGIILNETHFAHTTRFEARVESVRLTFERNQKQHRNREIRFYNFLLDDMEPPGIRCIPFDDMVIYEIDGRYLAEKGAFRNHLITFVSKTLRRDFRKIKVSVQVYPTALYDARLRKKGSKVTRLDLRYDRFTPVRIPTEGPDSKAPDLRPEEVLNDLGGLPGAAGSPTRDPKERTLLPEDKFALIRILVGMDDFSTSAGRKTALGLAGLAQFSDLPEGTSRQVVGSLLLRLEAEEGKPHSLRLLIDYLLQSDLNTPEKIILNGMIEKYTFLR